jgi:ABC-type Na+ efflux pump permease subunit
MNYTKVGQVAAREFVATVSTRGFIIGLLLMPAMLTLGFVLVPRLMAQRVTAIEGQVVIVDESGRVAADIASALSPDAVAARRAEAAREAQASVPEALRNQTAAAARQAQGEPPVLTLVRHPGAFARVR